jgi:hypothetical protein
MLEISEPKDLAPKEMAVAHGIGNSNVVTNVIQSLGLVG